MIVFYTSFILGLSFGAEAVPQETCEEMGCAWGILFDIGIIRLQFFYEYPDEEKPA
jgi:hypothetical protein